MSFTFNASGAGGAGGNGTNSTGQNANIPKTTSGGLFGTPASSSVFGQGAPATSGPPTSLFGSMTANTGGGTSGLFGNLTASSAAGSGTSTPAFGASTGNAPSAIFGQPAPNTSGPPPTNLFGGGGAFNSFGSSGTANFGQKKDEGEKSTAPANNGSQAPASGSLFGNSKPTGSLFGGTNMNSTSAPAGSTTPAKSTPFNLATSTTPAGPPPADNSQKPTGGLFGSVQPTGGLNFGASKPAESSSATAPTSGLFGGGLFGGAKPAGGSTLFGGGLNSSTPSTSGPAPATTAVSGSTAPPTFSFQSSTPAASPAPTSSVPSLFGAPKAPIATSTSTPAAAPGLFSNLGGASSSTPTSSAAPSSGLFPNLGGATPTTSAPINPSGGLFSSLGGASSSAASTSTPAAAPSLFSGTGGASASTPTSAAPAAPSGGFFSGLGGGSKPTSTPSTTAPTSNAASTGGLKLPPFGSSSSTSAPATTAPTSALFGNSTTTTSSQPSSTTPATTGATITTGTAASSQPAPSLANSTLGPAPQLTRLKNKTMDEIITRWATDLSKYQKDFKVQAEKVAVWDRLMVENGEKIQKLYITTYEAEKASNEIERQLSNVEAQQDELAANLDRYEAEVDDMFSRQIGQGETLQGPDQERERTYKLAEKLTDRLDEMGKNLTSMIDAINDASSTLSKTGKADDPLSTIVRVLNEHLSTLQWIDENATALQAKVADAQKVSQSIGTNGYHGPESEAADSFYRSFTSRK